MSEVNDLREYLDSSGVRIEIDSPAAQALYEYALGLLDRAEADAESNDDEGQGPMYMAGRCRVYSIEVAELAKALGLPATRDSSPVAGQKDGE